MLKKRILAIGLAMVTVLGSSMVVSAANHTHHYIREVYVYSYEVPKSHKYVSGILEDGTRIYAMCNYKEKVHVLQRYCAYCDATLGETVEGGRAQIEHDCK